MKCRTILIVLVASGVLFVPNFISLEHLKPHFDKDFKKQFEFQNGAVQTEEPVYSGGDVAGITTSKNRLTPVGIDSEISRSPVNIAGQIQTATGNDHADHKIYLHSSALNTSYRTRSDSFGFFSIPHVAPASDYVLMVLPEGMFKKSTLKKLTISALQNYVDVYLEPLDLTSVFGVIRNPSGRPLPNFEFRLRSLEKRFSLRTVETNSSGEFQVDNVPVGALEITKTFGQALIITGLNATTNQTQPLNLVVDRGDATLVGTILDSNNNIVPGATVVLSWDYDDELIRSAMNRRVTSDVNGRFEVPNIDSGNHKLIVTSSFGKPHKQNINIPPYGQDLLLVLHDTAVSY